MSKYLMMVNQLLCYKNENIDNYEYIDTSILRIYQRFIRNISMDIVTQNIDRRLELIKM